MHILPLSEKWGRHTEANYCKFQPRKYPLPDIPESVAKCLFVDYSYYLYADLDWKLLLWKVLVIPGLLGWEDRMKYRKKYGDMFLNIGISECMVNSKRECMVNSKRE